MRKFWVVREEGKRGSLLGVYPEKQFNEPSELIDGIFRNHPVHFDVGLKAENKLTAGERKEANKEWLRLELLALVAKVEKKAGTDTNGAIRDCVTDLFHIATWNDLDPAKLSDGAFEVMLEEQE